MMLKHSCHILPADFSHPQTVVIRTFGFINLMVMREVLNTGHVYMKFLNQIKNFWNYKFKIHCSYGH